MLQVQMSETAIVYRDGPLVELGAPPRRPGRTDVGARALDADWRDAATGETKALWPHISEPRHSLLVFEDRPGAIDVGKVVNGTTDQVGILRLDAAADSEHRARKRYHMRGPGWVLIRPDQVVAARGDSAALTILDTYLDRVVRSSTT